MSAPTNAQIVASRYLMVLELVRKVTESDDFQHLQAMLSLTPDEMEALVQMTGALPEKGDSDGKESNEVGKEADGPSSSQHAQDQEEGQVSPV